MSNRAFIDNDPAFVAQRYNELAPRMEALERRLWMPEGFRGRAITQMRLSRGDRVCVLGCGAGPEIPYILDNIGSEGFIDGLDLSSASLERAKAKCLAHAWHNVRLHIADAGKFVPQTTYHGVLFAFSCIAMSSHHEDVMRHIWQFVLPGGCMTVMDSRMPWFLRWARPLAQRYVNRTYLGDMRIRPKECLSMFGPVEDYSEKWDVFYAHTVFKV